MASKKRERLDRLLVEQGYFDTPAAAIGPVMAGDVRVNDSIVTKVGEQVPVTAEIVVRGLELKFASRGGYKLERALDRFEIDVTGLAVLDAGACTGGFTDCLLQRGAARVFAVDVGYGQMRGRLAADDRVVVLEKTNISDLIDSEMIDGPVSLVTADLSYLSLTKAIPILAQAVGNVPMVCLGKPLYEGLADESKASSDEILQVAHSLLDALADLGHYIGDIAVSPILGGRGAVEFLLHVTHNAGPVASVLVDKLEQDWKENPPI